MRTIVQPSRIAISRSIVIPMGPDALFGGKENVIGGIFEKLKVVNSELIATEG